MSTKAPNQVRIGLLSTPTAMEKVSFSIPMACRPQYHTTSIDLDEIVVSTTGTSNSCRASIQTDVVIIVLTFCFICLMGILLGLSIQFFQLTPVVTINGV